MPSTCKHPPEQLYCGEYNAFDENYKLVPAMWIGCLECHEIIHDRYTDNKGKLADKVIKQK